MPSAFLVSCLLCFLAANHHIVASEEEMQEGADEVVQNTNQQPVPPLPSDNNCLSLVDEISWPRIVLFDEKNASIHIYLNSTGPRVLTCLQGQASGGQNVMYELELVRKLGREKDSVATKSLTLTDWLVYSENEPFSSFNFVLLRGSYRVHFRYCDKKKCDKGKVTSQIVRVNSTRHDVMESWCLNMPQDDGVVIKFSPVIDKAKANFSFLYTPCHKVLHYETATVNLRQSGHNETSCQGTIVLETTVKVVPAHVINEHQLAAKYQHEAAISFQTPKLSGDRYYCAHVTVDHPFCDSTNPAPFLSDLGAPRQNIPSFCNFTSSPIYVPSMPFVAQWVPFCTSHFKCGWLYIVVVGSVTFLLSCMVAVMAVHCRCKKKRRKQSKELPVSPSALDTLRLTDIKPKRTWSDVHDEFYRDPPPTPGKILLLYSPDSKVFKDLQGSFRSFLELACHCVVLDLFDEELLEAIAYDPEAWIDQLLQDDRFKVIVVCSQGAYKRHQALLNGEVLNIPDTDSLDGLFSAGLRFLQERHYDRGRLAMARYETLPLCGDQFRLIELGADREFLVPTQLHELFCWIHNFDPLDLLGKPWVKYQLELQLLQDSLKVARMNSKR